jgi:hypothetical protein
MLEKSNEIIKDTRDALSKLEQEAKENSIADTEAGGSELDQWLGAVYKLRNFLKYHPNYALPEFKYLTAKSWLIFTADGPLQSEADYRKALAGLRQDAALAVGGIFGQAVKDFSDANGGKAPTQLSDIVKYLPKDFDPIILERYGNNMSGEAYMGADSSSRGDWIIEETAPPVDAIWNSKIYVSNIGEVFLRKPGIGAWAVDSVKSAIANYAKDNGAEPASADQIGKYIKTYTRKRAGTDEIDELFQALMNK